MMTTETFPLPQGFPSNITSRGGHDLPDLEFDDTVLNMSSEEEEEEEPLPQTASERIIYSQPGTVRIISGHSDTLGKSPLGKCHLRRRVVYDNLFDCKPLGHITRSKIVTMHADDDNNNIYHAHSDHICLICKDNTDIDPQRARRLMLQKLEFETQFRRIPYVNDLAQPTEPAGDFRIFGRIIS